MNETKDYLVQSSHLPLSAIIVGIGEAGFENMEILAGDSGLSDEQERKAERDLVKFVSFRNVNGNPSALAKQALAEIPEQVVKYHQLIGKKPNPQLKFYKNTFKSPVQVDINQLGFSSVQQQYPGQQPPFPGQQQYPGQQPPAQMQGAGPQDYPAQQGSQGLQQGMTYNPQQQQQQQGVPNLMQSQQYNPNGGQQNPYHP